MFSVQQHLGLQRCWQQPPQPGTQCCRCSAPADTCCGLFAQVMSVKGLLTGENVTLLGKLRIRLSTLWPNKPLSLSLPLAGRPWRARVVVVCVSPWGFPRRCRALLRCHASHAAVAGGISLPLPGSQLVLCLACHVRALTPWSRPLLDRKLLDRPPGVTCCCAGARTNLQAGPLGESTAHLRLQLHVPELSRWLRTYTQLPASVPAELLMMALRGEAAVTVEAMQAAQQRLVTRCAAAVVRRSNDQTYQQAAFGGGLGGGGSSMPSRRQASRMSCKGMVGHPCLTC